MTETWRPIPGYEGLYEVSDQGRVRRLRFRNRYVDRPLVPPRLVRQWSPKNGYRLVALHQHDRREVRLVSRLVLQAFVGPCPPGQEAAHLDGRRTNNALTNLRWKSKLENAADQQRHGTVARGERNGAYRRRRPPLSPEAFAALKLTVHACPNGHAYTPDNVLVYQSQGRRKVYCATCRRARDRARSARRRPFTRVEVWFEEGLR